ncbi:MAG: YfhO family protein [Oscillospiraceae bacterium]|nr:YfhO family protein [Oscillospiraceae bacterium]
MNSFSMRAFIAKNKAYILSFVIPAALLFISYLLFGVYPAGRRSVLALDLNAQYVYYYDYMYDVFAGKESLFYCWSRTFSGEFFGTFAYYLASPFNFIVWLFPREALTEGLLTMLLAKAAAGGLCCAFLLKKQRGFSDFTVIIFSLMYALSGYFAAHSINPMWLDGMIALPLVIMGVELICNKKDFLLYTISMLYVIVSNYYIGYMTGIFSAFYFAYFIASGRTSEPSGKAVGRAVIVYGASSVSAILMSGFIVIPAYKSLQMGKLDFGTKDFTPTENFNITDALLKLFPGTFDTIRPEGLPMLYCGTLALIFAVIYFVMKKIPLRQRVAGAALFGVILLSMYIKPVDMFWHGGAVPVWMPYRYSFLAVFLIMMFAAEAFESVASVKRKTLGAVFAGLVGLLLIADHYAGSEHFNTTLIIVIPLIVLSLMMGATVLYKAFRGHSSMKITLLVLLCAELLMNNTVTFIRMNKDVVYSERESYLGNIPETRREVDEIKALDGGFYRMEKTYHRCVNDPMAAGMYGLSHSSSVFNAKAISLAKTLGFGAREHYSRYDGATLLSDDIFGVKYILSKSELLSQYENALDIRNYGDIKAYVNEDALGLAYLASEDVIGAIIADKSPFAAQERLAARLSGEQNQIFVTVDDYATDLSNLNAGSTTDNHLSYKKRLQNDGAFVRYLVTAPQSGKFYVYFPTLYERECKLLVNDNYIKNYFENENHSIAYLGEFERGETFEVKLELYKNEVFFEHPIFCFIDEDALESFNTKIRSMNENTIVTRTGKAALSISVESAEDRALFTTIPFEEGWTATVDGKPEQILNSASRTFLCLHVPSGSHTIELKFKPAGMKTGLILTACGAVLFALMIVISKIKIPQKISEEIEEEDSENG